ncbi:unnamed protein product [Penicillium salamii]|uniref:Complex III subunit 9 n=1 Tax=Penicillium salamii TaxID=1612424 RepID=A0A9W4NVA8_9EURO|nr:unnamed protein product [Penicillium salamii]CAG8355966.1 unnamed protein product [Penicillium salamii]CAG8420814.1 unnamed protein product [Penicillium salamii]
MAGFANAIYSHDLHPQEHRSSDHCVCRCFRLRAVGYIRPDGEYLKLTKLLSISAFDIGSNKVWDSWNQGRQWKDIKHRYLVKEEEDDE